MKVKISHITTIHGGSEKNEPLRATFADKIVDVEDKILKSKDKGIKKEFKTMDVFQDVEIAGYKFYKGQEIIYSTDRKDNMIVVSTVDKHNNRADTTFNVTVTGIENIGVFLPVLVDRMYAKQREEDNIAYYKALAESQGL